jgi:hypothetical protein
MAKVEISGCRKILRFRLTSNVNQTIVTNVSSAKY